ncbi:ATP-binding protein [uncultured Croceicoccus sp.]|uniref:ATP-binding protein n=1 Tax=uncultured Croceicoccus sp. TaxID=1295329 RepID=UPI00260D30DF|nr:ATP-binding protein [uncultured Croceicoccus sp.]
MILKGGRRIALLDLVTDRDVAIARRRVGDAMAKRGCRELMQTRFVTAVSEIARNAIVHGGGGRLAIYEFPGNRKIGIECIDEGPGIADVEQAMTDGFSTRDSLGRGLGGAKRLSHEFEIETHGETGTIVRMTGLQNTR